MSGGFQFPRESESSVLQRMCSILQLAGEAIFAFPDGR
jgi:hypothetical protein